MNAIYLRRSRKVVLKPGSGSQPDDTIAAMQKNLEALGFVMSPALMERVRTLEQGALGSFYRSLIKDLRELVGAHREFKPMYPDFPEQVRQMPEGRLYLNAILHYLTNKLPVFAKSDRPAFEQKWRDLGVFVKYGAISDKKFEERAKNFALVESVSHSFALLDEYKEKIKTNQTDKHGKVVVIYTNDPDGHDGGRDRDDRRRIDHPPSGVARGGGGAGPRGR